MIHLALYEPDIPQNTGAAIRLAACLGLGLEIIEPCGFLWDARQVRQSSLDYIDHVKLMRHLSWTDFQKAYMGQRRILLTTKASVPYTDFKFKAGDILLAGRESAGVPEHVHTTVDGRILVPLQNGMRSLNVINALAIVSGEALRQLQL